MKEESEQNRDSMESPSFSGSVFRFIANGGSFG
jgi:Flp pilus assembly pilin Flp